MSVTPDTAPGAAPPGPAASHARWQELGDRVFKAACLLAALSVPALTALMVVFLTAQSLPSLSRFGLRFLVGTDWDKPGGHLGALPFIYGTLVTSAVAMALAVPLG